MSARIGIINNGIYKSIFLHNTSKLLDISINLRQYYKKKDIVEQLISLGDMSSLNKTIESNKYFYRDYKDPWNACVPYDEESRELIDINTNASPVDYYFAYHNNKWFVCEAYDNNWSSITKFINSLKK